MPTRARDGKLDHYSADILVRTASLVIDIFPLRPKREPLPPSLENQAIIVPGAPAQPPHRRPRRMSSSRIAGPWPPRQDRRRRAPSNQTIVADIPSEEEPNASRQPETYEVAEVVEEVEPEAPEPTPPSKPPLPRPPQRNAIPPGEEKLHEDAQRFARLLVQEIALYHPREVEQGKRNKNLYALLREDIDRSREAYDHRYQKPSVQGRQYFEKALAKYLADGDASLLGM